MYFGDHTASGDVNLFDPFEMRTRSIRIHGVVTSVGLENLTWNILLLIAKHNRLTLNQQVCKLHDEYHLGSNSAANFCSFLRTVCMLHLADHQVTHRAASATPSIHSSSVKV